MAGALTLLRVGHFSHSIEFTPRWRKAIVENPSHYFRALQRKGKRLLNLDYAYRERLPVKEFKELFPKYDGAPISLARYEYHPSGVRMNELTYLCYLSRYFPDG